MCAERGGGDGGGNMCAERGGGDGGGNISVIIVCPSSSKRVRGVCLSQHILWACFANHWSVIYEGA